METVRYTAMLLVIRFQLKLDTPLKYHAVSSSALLIIHTNYFLTILYLKIDGKQY